MTAKFKFNTQAFAAIYCSATALHKINAINKTTMRDFDMACLITPAETKPQQIKKIRELNHVSQPIFARYLNSNESTI